MAVQISVNALWIEMKVYQQVWAKYNNQTYLPLPKGVVRLYQQHHQV